MKLDAVKSMTLNEWRSALGFTWVELAAGTKLSYPSVNNWARGLAQIPPSAKRKIARWLAKRSQMDITTDHILN